ncbi:MAG: TonB-dependent receptor plug domain-containing protein [Gemmatimonadaceae bacterium]|nr:TonB-dependent receptor plug domain-containing protein [Gemmatimonadaceae bacterium]
MTTRSLVFIALALSVTACSAERLTGTAAQDAARQYQARAEVSAQDPLVFVDGLMISADSLQVFSPESIHSVEVVKGATAVKLYGERATRGVILVVTKAAAAKAAATSAAKPSGVTPR